MGTQTTISFEGVNGASLAGTGITLTGSGTAIHSSAEAVVGGTGAQFSATSSGARTARCAIVSNKTQAIDVILRTPPSLPAAGTFYVIEQFKTAAAASVISVEYNSAGKIDIYEHAGAVRNNIGVGTIAVSTQFRMSILVAIGVGTTDSNLTAKTYSSAANWTTQISTTLTRTGVNLGTVAIDYVDVGVGAVNGTIPGTPVTLTVGADYLRAEDGRTTEFGGPPAASAPTAVAAPVDAYPQVGDVVTLSSSGSAAGSGTLSYAWSCTGFPTGASVPAILTPTSASASFIPTAGGRYTIQLVVTQTGGLTDTTTTTVYSHPASGDDVKVFSATSATWTNEGGAASLTEALNDASSATFAQTVANPTGEKMRLVMNPYGPGAVSLFVKSKWSGGALNSTVDWYMADGVTLLMTETWAQTSVEVEHLTTLDSGDLATASPGLNRRALVVDISHAP